tara:strand:- start:166 stop:426 length:261 start_codon:yes stop_codon:yes gene_type:complete
MKIRIGERVAEWQVANSLNLLPSLFLQWGDGCIDNLDTSRVQRHFELEVHFDFLFFTSLVGIHLMWGDEGEVDYRHEHNTPKKKNK